MCTFPHSRAKKKKNSGFLKFFEIDVHACIQTCETYENISTLLYTSHRDYTLYKNHKTYVIKYVKLYVRTRH